MASTAGGEMERIAFLEETLAQREAQVSV